MARPLFFASLWHYLSRFMAEAAGKPFERDPGDLTRAFKFADLSDYPFKKRMMIRAADLLFYVLIAVIGKTIRLEVDGWHHYEQILARGKQPILTFWHNRIFMGTYLWRNRKVIVMTSQSFDGEYIARFVQRFGYGVARGSSTRGAVSALIEMLRHMKAGNPTAFTIDGPKGPREVAKLGAGMLAKKARQPILPFTVATENYWQVPSWDRLQIPKPFTRGKVFIGPPIEMSADADDAMLEAKQQELQRSLDDLTRRGEEWRASIR
jgi:lysophospholipid acyltransferase (LPLAT)-like uncharacterized protein